MSASFQRVPNLQIPSSPSDRRLRWSHHHRLIPPSLLQHRDAIAVTGALRSVDPRSGIRFLDPVVLRSADGGPRRRRGSVVRGCALGARVGDVEVERRRKRRAEVVVAAAMTALLGTGNRVLYKLALVPLKQYPFFLAQLATFGYVVVYFSILYARYHSGIVTDEMLSLPKTPYLAVGLLEALGAVSGMAAGAVLSGASIPILSQTFLVWQLLLSVIFLGRRYRFNQILGCFLVTIGVVITVASGSGAGDSLKNAGIFWALLMIISFLFQAADTVLKETIFLDAAKKLEGGSVDLFVVNSFGSAFQALFICLLLPFLSKLWGVPFNQLPTYIRDGAACFLNIGSLSSGCEGAPVLPLLFVIVNMAFNISLLHLLKISSAVVSCLASTFSVPLSIYAFTLPLPYIGVASSLPAGFVAGAVVLVAGLLLYSWTPPSSPATQAQPQPPSLAQG
ncbi:protein CLT1, chloroplastic-like isoform X1 [Phoenix dactylifera]|uniref:Protein CLT1, chloroplastic-like isoform X1 n=1 Tax=Phoenix dactylifera TaxID=42345 RepID=A0A8B9AT70_PHODC|nr:protein CLT1, chloroplastic-like isoform X1 [Phoenix dactylifera]